MVITWRIRPNYCFPSTETARPYWWIIDEVEDLHVYRQCVDCSGVARPSWGVDITNYFCSLWWWPSAPWWAPAVWWPVSTRPTGAPSTLATSPPAQTPPSSTLSWREVRQDILLTTGDTTPHNTTQYHKNLEFVITLFKGFCQGNIFGTNKYFYQENLAFSGVFERETKTQKLKN